MLYEQSALDGLAVDGMEGGLKFIVHQYPDTASASVPRDEVVKLRNALDDWLGDYGSYATPPPAAPQAERSLIDQLIRRAAAEAVDRSWEAFKIRDMAREEFERLFEERTRAPIPLHLSPVADPEPHDVGHVDEPAEPYQRPLHMVSKADCQAPRCTSDHLSGVHGRLTAEIVPVKRMEIVECRCTHWSGWHGPSGCTNGPCACKWTGLTPDEWIGLTSVACSECDHLDQAHAVLNGGCTACNCTRSRGVL